MTSLIIGSLGVVFGDIGTSPLYTLKLSLQAASAHGLAENDITGVVSLIFWTLTTVVSFKYVVLILRADNQGEGGLLSLLALVLRRGPKRLRYPKLLLLIGLFGASFFFADAILTPAISVLSAIEGLELANVPESAVMPLSLVVLIALFSIQRHGTERVGRLFGPIMLLWFLTLGVTGCISIYQAPRILLALDPIYGIQFLVNHGLASFLVLASVVLAVTGAEALYADMGHFGRRPIQLSWTFFVYPCLALNYFGQGALVMRDPAAIENPFYFLVPSWGLLPMIILATCATIIASQAVITGAYSITRQAINLGFLPRMNILHTSETTHGQIYIPRINWTMMSLVILLVVSFHTSENLAGAYGIAVTAAMLSDSILAFVLYATRRGTPMIHPAYIFVPLLVVDIGLFIATLTKIGHGGVVPLTMGMLIFACMTTWRTGREALAKHERNAMVPVGEFVASMAKSSVPRVAGTAVFLTPDEHVIPRALLHNLKHNKVLHQRVVLLSVNIGDAPHLWIKERVRVDDLGTGFYRLVAEYGFMDRPDIMEALRLAEAKGLVLKPMETSFFLGHQNLVRASKSSLSRWRQQLFILLSSWSETATAYFQLPSDRVVELGSQTEV